MNRTHTEEDNAKRRQGGRPRLPDGEKRDRPVKVYFDRANYSKLVRVKVYFDRANYSKLVRRSRRSGRPLSEIVYELAVNGYVREALPQDAVSALRSLAGMANNLNQLARLGHIHGPAYIAEENSRLSKEISGLIVRLNEQL